MDTKKARIARVKVLSKMQKEIVIGSLLGDAYLVQTTRGYAFREHHGIAQKEYVDWKYDKLKELTNSPPKETSTKSYYFRTVSHLYFSQLHNLFYSGTCKIVPLNISNWLTPLSLSIWIMDDGSRDRNQMRINTQSFTKQENEFLISILKAKLGINATLNQDKDKYRLRVSAESMSNVRQLISPHLIPSMRYKLSL